MSELIIEDECVRANLSVITGSLNRIADAMEKLVKKRGASSLPSTIMLTDAFDLRPTHVPHQFICRMKDNGDTDNGTTIFMLFGKDYFTVKETVVEIKSLIETALGSAEDKAENRKD